MLIKKVLFEVAQATGQVKLGAFVDVIIFTEISFMQQGGDFEQFLHGVAIGAVEFRGVQLQP
jgi:hypothetical protein